MRLNAQKLIVLTEVDLENNKIPKLENSNVFLIHMIVLRVSSNMLLYIKILFYSILF